MQQKIDILPGEKREPDPPALEELIQAHAEVLWRSAVVMCRDEHTARDLTQETWLEVWKCFARFDGRCKFSTWVHGILRHRFLKNLRRNARILKIATKSDQASETPVADGARPGEQLLQDETTQTLRSALQQLPEDQAQVLELRFFAGASLSDIAESLACPKGTVKSRLHHGLKKLRENSDLLNLLNRGGES